jgi:hypothetical protein
MWRALIMTAVLAAGCGGDETKKYDTYQACFDDLTQHQNKMKVETIVKCCLDFEIGGSEGARCGDTDSDCINYLTANLKQTDADISTQMEACGFYVAQKPAM